MQHRSSRRRRRRLGIRHPLFDLEWNEYMVEGDGMNYDMISGGVASKGERYEIKGNMSESSFEVEANATRE